MVTKAKLPLGRPSDYTEEMGLAICSRLADGESLRTICSDKHMPSKTSVFRWLEANEIFRDHYARAREALADYYAEDIIQISDDATNDWMERRSEAEKGAGVNTGWVINGEHVQRSRLRVEARKWIVSKLYPKKYGEKIQQEIDVKHDVTVTFQSAAISAVNEIIGEATAVRASLPHPDALPN